MVAQQSNLSPGAPLIVPAGPSGIGLAAQAALPAVAGKINFLQGWDIEWDSSGTGAVPETVFVVLGSVTLQYRIATVGGVGGSFSVSYPYAVPALAAVGSTNQPAAGTAITVGVSGTASRASLTINAYGYLL